MTAPGPNRSGRSMSLLTLVAIVVVPVVAIAAVVWVTQVRNPMRESVEQSNNIIVRLSGLDSPVVNKLDPKFTDADGDLVAGPPADPKQLVDPDRIEFSYVAVEDPQPFAAAWKDFMAHLSKVTGKPVDYVPAKSVDEQLRDLRDGKLHVTGLNTGNVPAAVDLCGFVPVVKLARDDGTATYQMEIIVPADSSMQSPADLRGHELTLTEPSSNSGYKAPLVLLRNNFGLLPGRDYQIRTSYGHDESIIGIAHKEYEAAAVANDVLRRAVAQGEIKANQYRSIYKSENFPTAGLGYVYNLKPELVAKIKDAFSTFDWKGTSVAAAFAPAEQNKFVPADYKNDWALVRQIEDASGTVHRIREATATTEPTAPPATAPAQ